MRKVWTTFIFMFSLFFLCNFSYAATATITVIDIEGNETVYTDNNSYLTSDVNYTFDLREYSWISDYSDYILVRTTGSTYRMRFFNMVDGLEFYYDDNAIHNPGDSQTEYSILHPFVDGSPFSLTCGRLLYNDGNFTYGRSGTFDERIYNYANNGKYTGLKILDSSVPIKKGIFAGTFNSKFNSNVTCTLTDIVLYESYFGAQESIKMENPLTDDEIKSILEIFLESVRDSDLPEHYGRYVLVYNKSLNRYTGFVYPSYINLGMRYVDFDENEEIHHVENAVGPYYYFVEYSHDDNYISQFLDGIDLGMKNPLIYEFRSNSDNSYFRFNTTYNFGLGYEDSFIIETLNEPIIYTSHKIYSLFLTGTDIFGFGQYEVDENSSIGNQIFVDSETGENFDDSLNEYTDEIIKDVTIFSFIKLLFGFIYSCVSFVIRFFSFLITFVNVPATTAILPDGFVQGIEWVQSFTFGEILLWDIFSIFFDVLLGIYILRLINETSG